ncbi:hypothetical protein [Methanobrevibacter sp. V14]|uniref:hypothetical protein n=1 Tax=Methanobrevibacter sp. V14 TaxID=3064280 RepID=UPI00273440DE|nr:hypothetical protein [Methanobrevibacter sp. V14]
MVYYEYYKDKYPQYNWTKIDSFEFDIALDCRQICIFTPPYGHGGIINAKVIDGKLTGTLTYNKYDDNIKYPFTFEPYVEAELNKYIEETIFKEIDEIGLEQWVKLNKCKIN